MNIDKEFRYDILFPKRIVHVAGNVENEASLLTEKELQITTDEKDCVILKNERCGQNAEIILDFGVEINGSARILTFTVDGGASAEMQVVYGESVSETVHKINSKGSTNDHSIRDFTYSFPDFSDMTFNESGFRFVRICLLSRNTSIKIKSIAAIRKIRDIPYLGSFRCNNETLNKIYDVSAYTCHLNMQQFIWDGVKRDRLVWVGDMHPEMLTVRTVFGNHPIIRNSLNFMRKQTDISKWMNGMPTYSLWWLIILYDWYFYSGDEDFLAENKEYCINLIKKICTYVNDDGSDTLPSYFLDWPCNDKPQSVSGSRALFIIALEKAAELCRIFNETEPEKACRSKAELMRGTELNTYSAKQVSAIACLAGWLDKNSAAKEILHNSSEGWSTFMSYYLLKAASYADMNETLRCLEEYYGGMLKMGATTFWEDFDITWLNNAARIDEIVPDGKSDIHGDNGRFCYKGLRHSLCHGWASGPAAFLAEEVLGIKILEAGCKKIKIAPSLGSLEFAEGTYPTPYGVISVFCKRNGEKTDISYTVPDGIEVII